MTQRSRPWDGTVTGDASEAPYDAATEWSKVWASISGAAGVATNVSGVFRNELNQLATTGATSPVSTDTGRSMTWGAWYENDVAIATVIPTPAASTRIDRIVLRKSWASQTVRLTRLIGVEGGGAPALTQVAGTTWDQPLYQVSITTGGAITLTDEREMIGGAALPSSWSTGSLIYASSTTALAALSIGANNSVLVSNGSLPSWSTTPTVAGLTVTTNGIQVTAGNVGMGAAPSAAASVFVSTTAALTGVNQYGVLVQPDFSSSATTSGQAGYFQLRTVAAAFTMVAGYGLYIHTANIGAGSAVTTNYGLYVATQSGGGTNYAIYTNSGLVRFGDAVTIASGGIAVTGTSTITGSGSSIPALRINYTSASEQGLQLANTAASGKTWSIGPGIGVGVGDFGIYNVTDGAIRFSITAAGIGTLAAGLTLTAGNLNMASASAISWNAGDVTITHSANALAFAGASSGYSFDATVTHRALAVAADNTYDAWAAGTRPANAYIVNLYTYGSLNIVSGGATIAAGNLGIGGAASTANGIEITGAILTTAADQRSFYSHATASVAATDSISAGTFTATSVNSAFSTIATYGIRVTTPSKGAGHTMVSVYGAYIQAQTTGGTNNYGVYIEAPSGGSGSNIGLYNAGTTTLVGATGIGGAPNLSTDILALSGTKNISGGNDLYAWNGTNVIPTVTSGTSAVVTGMLAGFDTTINVGATLTRLAAIYVRGATAGVSGTLTNHNSLYLGTPIGGTTIRVIDTASGAYLSTAGIWTDNPSWLALKSDVNYYDRSRVGRLLDWHVDNFKPMSYKYDADQPYEHKHFSYALDDINDTEVFEILTADKQGAISGKDERGYLLALVQELGRRVKELTLA